MQKYHVVNNKISKKFYIKDIFKDHWAEFLQQMKLEGTTIRQAILDEVQKTISCQDPKMGYRLYFCTNCDSIKYVPFTCKSRFCNCCGVKYSKDRALSISSKLLDSSHRHVVFTIPKQLRKYFAIDRSLLDILFKAAADTILYFFHNRNKSEDFTPGMICVLHTFGRDLKWNPHIHMLLSEGGIGNIIPWLDFSYIDYEALRKSFQFILLKLMSEKIHTPDFKPLVDSLYKVHDNGFYVRALPNKNMNNNSIANYIIRYIGRPVMAQSRIFNYDGVNVTYFYKRHEDNKTVIETVSAFDFIKKLIIHIPQKNFKMLRYYGFYCVSHKKYKVYLSMAKRMSKLQFDFLSKSYKSWRSRIKYFFGRDPLKCLCGNYYEYIDFFNPTKYYKYINCIKAYT